MERFKIDTIPFKDVKAFLPEMKTYLCNRNLDEITYYNELEA
jgi:hypothetical protein